MSQGNAAGAETEPKQQQYVQRPAGDTEALGHTQ